MGVVLKQSFWTSAFSYLGVIIGYLNTLLILPAFFTPGQIGLYNQIQSAALLLVPLVTLGMGSSAIRFYPKLFKQKSSIPAFMGFLLLGAVIGILVSSVLLVLFSGPILSIYESKTPEIKEFYWVIIAILAGLSLSTVFESISKARLKIIVPNLSKDVLFRLLKMLFLIMFGYNLISFKTSINSLVVSVFIMLLTIIIYTFSLGGLKFSFKFETLSSELKNEIKNYAFYAVLGSLGNVMVMNVDIQMVAAMMGNEATGIYATAFYIGVVIDMPRRAISQISAPIISQSFKENDMVKIGDIYKKLGLNQLIIGVLLFIGIIVNLDSIYQLIPNNERFLSGLSVVYFIGLSRLTDMGFSINGEIILMSKHYRFNVICVVLLAILTVILNIFFIPAYGITGAAIATSISILLFNLVKFLFVRIKLQISPFSWSQLMVLIVGLVITFLSTISPKFENPLLDILIRSTLVTIIYIGLLLLFRISDELQNIFSQLSDKYFKTKN